METIMLYITLLMMVTTLLVIGQIAMYFMLRKLLSKKTVPPPSAVSIVSAHIFKEENMTLYKYTFMLPLPGATDVVNREMHVDINGVMDMVEIDPSVTEHSIDLEEDSNVSIYMIDIDDAGNRSAKGETFSFVVVDMVPPDAPGAVTIKDVVEVQDEVVIEEPVMDEVVIEEPVMDAPVEDAPAPPVEVIDDLFGDVPAEEPAPEEDDLEG